MFSSDVAPVADPVIAAAISAALSDPDRYSWTLGELFSAMEAAGHTEAAVGSTVEAMLYAHQAFVSWPLSLLDEDSEIFALRLKPGYTNLVGAKAQFSRSVVQTRQSDCNVALVADFYSEFGAPPVPSSMSHAERDALDPRRPASCTLPWGPVLPHEVMQLIMRFGAYDRLIDVTVMVSPKPPRKIRPRTPRVHPDLFDLDGTRASAF